MADFTISQEHLTPLKLYLFPSSDGCKSACSIYPNTGESHYEDVDDPRLLPDDNSTYVFGDEPSQVSDLYTLPNPSVTGTINSIKVYSRAMHATYSPEPETEYKIMITDNNCTNLYTSDNKELLQNSYKLFSYQWADNPRTSTTWTWADINNLQIGLTCKSPVLTSTPGSMTLRPNAAGSTMDWIKIGGGGANTSDWLAVDEIISDGDTSYLYNNGVNNYDVLAIQDPSSTPGNIINVTVYAVARDESSGSNELYLAVNSGGTYSTLPAYPGYTLTTTYATYSQSWTTNPNTGVAWTWVDITNLEVGIRGKSNHGSNLRCTQIYAIINYEVTTSPELRCTQTYVKILYTPDDTECNLTKPEEISLDQEENIKMLNMWSGNRYVYALNRNKKTIVMKGTEYGNGACDRILCIEEMAENKDPITISGLTGSWWNKEYRILSFGYNKITECPEVYNWILELERTS